MRAVLVAGGVLGLGLALAFNEKSREVIADAARAVTDKLAAMVEGFEGFRAEVYDANPPHGDWTVGIGHAIKPGERFFPYGDVTTITRAEADDLFFYDTQEARQAVSDLVTVGLSGNQRAALESFVFNVGRGAFANSTLLRLLNQGDYNAAAAEFDRWVFAKGKKLGGLVARRASEKEVFLT